MYTPENPTSDIGDAAQSWLRREFEALQDALLNPVVGQTGLTLATPVASTTLLTQTPVKVLGYDAKIEPEILGFADIGGGTIEVHQVGLWHLTIKGVARIVAHTGNFTRGIVVQLYDETAAQTFKIIDYVSISRYQDILDYTVSLPVYVPRSRIGNKFAVYAFTTTTNTVQFTSIEILDYDFILSNTIERA